MRQIPVYLFTGFLEAGKTKFIQETLEDKRFNAGERTLILLCEEGICELNLSRLSAGITFVEKPQSSEELTREYFVSLEKKYKPERIILEYNGMWLLTELQKNLPDNWMIYQNFLFADANTFLSYNANMRSLVVDKLQCCDLVVFNRSSDFTDQLMIHKVVRGTTRRASIAFEYPNGKVVYDEIEDPLPFDVNAPVIEIRDADYALWYRDILEEPKKYDGKTVRFKGIVAKGINLPPDLFIVGRHVMTCCIEDVKYSALVCGWDGAKTLNKRDWVIVTAKIEIRYHKIYGSKGPVLTALCVEKTEKPEKEIATFY